MMKINRPEAPEWLTENWENWGQEYIDRLNNNPNYQFSWKQYQGEKVNHRLLPILKMMTNNHCSFCDGFPMGLGVIKETIEHFYPKARNKFPQLAYQWENLFLCCHFCQEKNDDFDEKLLKPDEINYTFEKYFTFNFRTFEIEVRRDANIIQADKERAETTLKLYKINDFGRPKAREMEFRKYSKLSVHNQNINDYSYRFMFLKPENQNS